MKHTQLAFVSSCLLGCIMPLAQAAYPVTLSVETAVPLNVPVNSTATAYYTVSNYSGSTIPLSISGISPPITQGISGGQNSICAAALANNTSCDIPLVIAPVLSNQNETIQQTLTVSYGGKKPLIASINFNAPYYPTLIAVGQRYETPALSPPLIAAGTLNMTGSSVDWVLPVPPTDGTPVQLNTSACFGSFCIAGGEETGGSGQQKSIALKSTNYGIAWTNMSLISPQHASFNASSCANSGSNTPTFCMIGGEDSTTSNLYLFYNPNAASSGTWNSINLGAGTTPTITTASCSNPSTGSAPTCVAGGYNIAGPFLIVGASGIFTTAGLSAFNNGQITGVSCTPNPAGTDVFCMVIGVTTAGAQQIFINSTTHATPSTWSGTTITPLTNNALFNSVSCTTTLTTPVRVICAIGGKDTSIQPRSLLYTYTYTTIGTWSDNAAPPTDVNSINALSCTTVMPTGSTVVCAANEENDSHQSTYVWTGINTADATFTWSRNPSFYPNVINTISCTPGASEKALCMAAGADGTTGSNTIPKLYYNLDSGNSSSTWTHQPLPSPNNGIFYGAATIAPEVTQTHESQPMLKPNL